MITDYVMWHNLCLRHLAAFCHVDCRYVFVSAHTEYTLPLDLLNSPALQQLLASKSDNLVLDRDAFMEILSQSTGGQKLDMKDSLRVHIETVMAENEKRLVAMESEQTVAMLSPKGPKAADSLPETGPVLRGGPRIKHVCRRAAVALGTPATFPTQRELTLSALPKQEKVKILQEGDDCPGRFCMQLLWVTIYQ